MTNLPETSSYLGLNYHTIRYDLQFPPTSPEVVHNDKKFAQERINNKRALVMMCLNLQCIVKEQYTILCTFFFFMLNLL